ncbi:MAG: DUF4249 domain-containing protein [Microscillaceae bacterium]|nr:DUF4249 domain-containing protein [Microscillaceae bacterium]
MKNILGFFILLWAFSQCVEPFEEFDAQDFEDYLVVEGLITNETKAHRILISRTSPIDSLVFIPETEAQVHIEDEQGNRFPLSEKEPGKYFTTPNFTGIIGQSYTLLIQTSSGRNYRSDAVTLKSCPPIDSIYAEYRTGLINRPDGIEFYVDSHDPSNQTRYYRWEWEETYEIVVPFASIFEWIQGNEVRPRTENVGNCWKSDTSSTILIKNTIGLANDQISRFPVRFMDKFSQEIRTKYSILVKQYALSEEAFTFWSNLQESQTRQGSLFDIQPGIIQGNIRSLDDKNEIVLGYFDASQVSTLREFFVPSDFNDQGFVRPSYFANCFILDTIPEARIGEYLLTENNLESREIWDSFGAFGFTDIFYVIVPKACANCTGFADKKRPSFWR